MIETRCRKSKIDIDTRRVERTNPMRPAAQILACIVTGLGTGAVIVCILHGYEPTLRIAHALLEYAML